MAVLHFQGHSVPWVWTEHEAMQALSTMTDHLYSMSAPATYTASLKTLVRTKHPFESLHKNWWLLKSFYTDLLRKCDVPGSSM